MDFKRNILKMESGLYAIRVRSSGESFNLATEFRVHKTGKILDQLQ